MQSSAGAATGGAWIGPFRVVSVVAVSFVAVLCVVLAFALPRPFYVWENDYDNGFYYIARAAYFGLPIHNVEHPGTPVILLEKLLMTSTTARLDHVQSFLNELYLVVGLAYSASIGLFCVVVLRRFSDGVAALTLASMAAWPPFLAHLNQYCTDSFVLVAGLAAVAAFWMILAGFPHPRASHAVFAGAACGLCLAIKLSFLPFVLTLELAAAVSLLRAHSRRGPKLRNLFVLWVGTIGAFVLATLPVAHRLDETLLHTLRRGDVRMPNGAAQAIGESGWALLRESPAFVVLFAAVIALVVITAVRRLRVGSDGNAGAVDGDAGFDVVGGFLFLALLSVSFVYAIACAAPDLSHSYSVGNSLRNATPSAFVVPVGILYIARLGGKRWSQDGTPSVWQTRAMVAGALGVVIASVALHLVVRSEMIHGRLARIVETKKRLDELRRQYGLVAFWDKQLMGEVSFHFWGNYRYAGSYFDDELLAKFKGTSWLDLRDIQRLSEPTHRQDARELAPAGASVLDAGDVLSPPLRRALHWLHQQWLPMKEGRPVFPGRPSTLYAGENRRASVGFLAFSETTADGEVYKRLGWKQPDLKSRLEESLGPLRLWKEKIGGLDWVFLEPLNGTAGTPREPGMTRAN